MSNLYSSIKNFFSFLAISAIGLMSLLLPQLLNGQDIHFTQIDVSQIATINPAATGDYDADWRFGGIYRSQWPNVEKAFSTTALFYDRHLNEKFSGGLVFFNDQSGAGLNRLNVNKLYASAAYHLPISKHKLNLGAQLGGVFKSLEPNTLTFPRQYDREIGQFNSELASDETSLTGSKFYVDANVGINLKLNFGKFQPNIGVAALHVIQPNESFLDEKANLPMRLVGDLGLDFVVNESFRLHPYVMGTFMNQAQETLFGLDLHFNIYENATKVTGLFAGMGTRLDAPTAYQDAVFLKGGLYFGNLRFGLAYDINVSDLQAVTNNFGAIELSMVYMPLPTRLKKIQVPCDRF